MSMHMLSYFMVYLLIGGFAGLVAGILGVGGGIIVVPGLVFIFQNTDVIPQNISMHIAAGSSLAVMIFTSIAAIIAHSKQEKILWPVFHSLWPGIVLGAISGASLAEFLPTHWLEIIFALFLFFVAYKMFMDLHVTYTHWTPAPWINRLVSYLIGFKSGLLGVGGGVLIIPYLTYCGVETRRIAAVSNLCTFTVGVVGATSFILLGHNQTASIPYTTGYVYWPAVAGVTVASTLVAFYGARLNYILPVKLLKSVFIVILLLTAIKMLF